MIFGANNVLVEHYGEIVEIQHGCPFEGLANGARPSHLFWQKSTDCPNLPCPVRSALKRTHMQDFNSFSIMFNYLICTKYKKFGDLFYPVYISGLSHSVFSSTHINRIDRY